MGMALYFNQSDAHTIHVQVNIVNIVEVDVL